MKVLVHSVHLRGYWSDWDITLPKEHPVLLAEHPVAKKIAATWKVGSVNILFFIFPIRLGRRHHPPMENAPSPTKKPWVQRRKKK
jgi:hypothetical protein